MRAPGSGRLFLAQSGSSMGEDHRPGPDPQLAPSRVARSPELWVVIEVPEPIRSEVLMVRRIVSRAG